MVNEQVSNVAIGQMRMQFWRDAVKGIYNVCVCVVLHSYPLGNLTLLRALPHNTQSH